MGPVLARHPDLGTGPATTLRRLVSDQRVAFIGVGAVNTLVGAIVFVALQLSLGQVVNYLVVLLCAHLISVLCAYALHRRMVFKVTGNVLQDLVRFESVYLTALALNALLLPILVEVADLPVIAAQLLIVAATSVLSFLGHKHWSFRRRRSGRP
jgi:putative flippase GtrA